MNPAIRKCRLWAPTVAVAVAVVLSLAYAVREWTSAITAIEEARRVGEVLCSVSENARAGVLPPEEARALENQKVDLERRLDEAGKPGMVQAALVESAAKVGLIVQEVLPVAAANGNSGRQTDSYPAYRVAVQGTYTQIAEYLQACKNQRVPTRPVGFRLAPATDDTGGKATGLKAEITLESFLRRSSNNKGRTVG